MYLAALTLIVSLYGAIALTGVGYVISCIGICVGIISLIWNVFWEIATRLLALTAPKEDDR